MPKSFRKFLLLLLPMVLCMASLATAQTITGNISGTVTDPSGAVVRDAKVVVTNVDTGVTTSATTNVDGIYNVRFLPIGKYRVVTESKGFSKQTFGPFALEINQTAKVDVKLLIGAESTNVDVSSALVPLLDTEDNTISTILTANTIENIPLSGRNWSSLTLFTPGAVSTNPTSFGGSGNQNAIERNQNGGGVAQAQTNGNRAEGNNYRLDGIEINETLNNLVGYNPNPDAIDQLQIISANAPAQYGNVNGCDVIALTKSGTNKFHGSVGAYLQNQLLDANTYGNKHVPSGTAFTARNPYTQLQFSATVGGPIIKDKLFFFADYFGTRYHQGGLGFASVLTAKMRTGDFSELLNPGIMQPGTATGSALIQLYDTANNFTPYNNNQVPVNNSVFAYLAAHPQYYPLPNVAAVPGIPTINNYRGSQSKHIYNNQGDIKVDFTPTQKDRFFVRYSQGEAGDSQTVPLAVNFQGSNVYPVKGVAIDYSRMISNAIVNDVRVGFTRVRWTQGAPIDSTGAFGSNGNKVVGIPATQAFAGFASQSVGNLTTAGNAAGGTFFVDNSFIYDDDLSWQLRKHLLHIGVDLVRYQQNNFYPGNDGANGNFSFSGAFTGTPTVTGFAAADWALDRANFSGIGAVTGPTGQRQWRSAYYVQDDWKITPTLTLNLGLRYQYFQQVYEVNNKTMNYDPTTKTFEYAGKVPTNSPYAGATVCKNRSCLNPYYNGFMPRVGFAYQVTPRLVVRGGFGITKAMEGTGANLRLTYNAPFANSLEANATNPSTGNGGRFLQEKNGFTAPNGAADIGGFPRIEDPNIKPQATNEYSLTTEYQLNNFSSIKIGYVGESSSHLIQAARPNQLTKPCVVGGVVRDPNDSNYTAACAASDPAPFLALVGENGFVFQTIAEGAAAYNGLQVQYRQRALKGLEFTVNYAYAHAFSNSAGFFGVSGTNAQGPYAQNMYDNHAEWGPTASDIRHSLNGTLVYALPFGIGRTYANHVNRFVDGAIGGWKVSMTGIAYSGLPVTVAANNVSDVNNHCCSSRPNQISNLKVSSHTLNNWFGGVTGTAKYAQPILGTFGTARPGTERAPGFQQYDASLFKDFTVYHENRLGFRVDAYNLFNLTSLGNPNNNFNDPNFGQIQGVKSVNRQLTVSAKYQF